MQATWASMVPNVMLSLARPLYHNRHPLRFQAAHSGQSPLPLLIFSGGGGGGGGGSGGDDRLYWEVGRSTQLLPIKPQRAYPVFPHLKGIEVREYIL